MSSTFLRLKYLFLVFFFCASNKGYAQLIDTLKAQLEVAFEEEDSFNIVKIRGQMQEYYLEQEDWEACVINYCEKSYDYWNFGRPADMEVYLDSAFAFAKLKEVDTLSSAYGYLWNYYGWYYNENVAYQKAIEVYKKGLNLELTNNNDSIEIARASQNLATQFDNVSDYQQSIYYYEFALLYLPAYDFLRAQILNNLGLAHQNIELVEEAIEDYLQALKIIEHLQLQQDEKDMVIYLYSNLATAYNDLKDFSKAYFYLRKLKALLDVDNIIDLADYYHVLGGIDLRSGSLVAAENHLKLGLQFRRKALSDKHPHTANSYREVGDLLAQKKRFKEALTYYQKAFYGLVNEFKDTSNTMVTPDIGHNIVDHIELLRTLNRKGQALVGISALEEAKKVYLKAIELADFLRTNYQAENSKYYILAKVSLIYEEAIELAFATDDIPLAFQLTERSKATLLIENIKNIEAKAFLGIPDSLIEQETEIKIQIAQYERQWSSALLAEETDKVKAINQELFQLRQTYQQFVVNLENQYPEYHQLKYAVEYPTIADVQHSIVKDSAVLVEYFLGDSAIFAFVITDEEAFTHTIPRTTVLDNHIQQLIKSIDTLSFEESTYRNFTQSSFYLYQHLLGPLLGKLKQTKQTLTIVPDGIIGLIPFQVLLSEQAPITSFKEARFDTLPYLVERYAINYAYSSTLLLAQTNNEKLIKRKSAINFGGFAPIFEKSLIATNSTKQALAELRHSEGEVKAIHYFLGGELFLGSEATRQQFLDKVNQFKIIHLSTHAEAATTAINTKIHFLDDFLTVKDIYNTSLSADLTVLSACETGIGKLQRGEGIISLERAFMYAGCPSMVTSLWQVDDSKTASLLVNFYEYLERGTTKSMALQKAQINYLRNIEASESAHPFYWAAFIQTGANNPIFTSRIPWLHMLGGIVLLALILGFFYTKRRPSIN